MIIHHVRVMTKPGLQAGARHRSPFPFRVPDRFRVRLAFTSFAVALVSAVCASGAQAQSATPARYRITSTSVVALDRQPQAPLVDTIGTSALLAIDIATVGDTIATLSLDSLTVVSTGMVRRAPTAFSRGISISVPLHAGRPQVTGDSASSCSTERPMAAMLPELLPLLPSALTPDTQWSDTLTVHTCRAGLPVALVTVASYRIMTGMDSLSVLLERRAVTTASGAATLKEQSVTLTGAGSSESLAVVLVAARRVQSWRSSQQLDVSITNGQQTRNMSQRVTDTATLIP